MTQIIIAKMTEPTKTPSTHYLTHFASLCAKIRAANKGLPKLLTAEQLAEALLVKESTVGFPFRRWQDDFLYR